MLLLVDLNCWVYRQWAAKQPIRKIHNNVTEFIVVAALRSGASHVAACADSRESTRKSFYPQYKAQRPPKPSSYYAVLADVEDTLELCAGVRVVGHVGAEADDVIATLATKAREVDLPTVILAMDKDLFQLVQDSPQPVVKLWDGATKWTDGAGVRKKLGVNPAQVVDYLALVGDGADNIPGVPKMGPVGAVQVLKAFGSLDGALEHLDTSDARWGQVKRRYREALAAGAKDVEKWQALTRLASDLQLGVTIEDLRWNT